VQEIRKVADAIMLRIQRIEEAIIVRNLHESLKKEIKMIPEMVDMPDEELDMHVNNLILEFENYITGKGISAPLSGLGALFFDFWQWKTGRNYSQDEKNIVDL
jgi:hypothetical protein